MPQETIFEKMLNDEFSDVPLNIRREAIDEVLGRMAKHEIDIYPELSSADDDLDGDVAAIEASIATFTRGLGSKLRVVTQEASGHTADSISRKVGAAIDEVLAEH
jgi:hypothetical protein